MFSVHSVVWWFCIPRLPRWKQALLSFLQLIDLFFHIFSEFGAREFTHTIAVYKQTSGQFLTSMEEALRTNFYDESVCRVVTRLLGFPACLRCISTSVYNTN